MISADNKQSLKAWQFILAAANVEKISDLSANATWLKNNRVIITSEGKLNFYHHVFGDIESKYVQEYIKSIKVGLYQKYGDKLTNVLRQAAEYAYRN